jgi:hypothetical protein
VVRLGQGYGRRNKSITFFEFKCITTKLLIEFSIPKSYTMKFTHLLIFGVLFVMSCSSPEKLLVKGNYDALIEKSVKNLIKKPNSEEDADNLDKAYKLANDRDLERIKYLKMEGNPNTWDEMLGLYGSLKNRQASVRRVLPLHTGGRTIQYEYVDYDAEMVAAKRKAAEYYYNHGKKLMEGKTKESYRQAYGELRRAQDYSGDSYSDLSQLISQTHDMGMSRVLVSSINKTILNLPADFMDGLVAVNANELNSQWVEYYTRKMDKEPQYDYYIDIILQNIEVSPDVVQDKDAIQKKTVDNGFDYALDSKGNVMKDTAGNDIKIKKYKEIQCTLIETHQSKDCNIKGEIEFSSANPQALMKKQPIGASTHFEHVSARAIGDVNALTPESKQLIEMKPVPFPDDIRMVVDCMEALKKAINEAIQYNRGILQ